jgi:hypothetical protein
MLEKNIALMEFLESLEKCGKTGKIMLHWSDGVCFTVDFVRAAPIIDRRILVNGKFIYDGNFIKKLETIKENKINNNKK